MPFLTATNPSCGRGIDRRGGWDQQDDALPPLPVEGRTGGGIICANPRKRPTAAGRASKKSILATPARSFRPGSRRWPATSQIPTSAVAPSPTPPSNCRTRITRRDASSKSARAAQRTRLVQLCDAAELSEPDMLADELHLLLEGARVTAQSVGSSGLGARLIRMGEAMIASHAAA